MSSDRMMEYYYSMGQDCLTNGALDDAVTYFRKAANMGAGEAAYESAPSDARWKSVMG